MTPSKEAAMNEDLKKKLKKSDVKVLYESELKEIGGEEEVEKVVVYDLDEDNQYELFVDSVVILRPR
jgi:thioredoxin reductase